VNPHEHLKSALELEVERARQNIEDIEALERAVSLNVAKSRVLLAEAARIEEPLVRCVTRVQKSFDRSPRNPAVLYTHDSQHFFQQKSSNVKIFGGGPVF